VSEDPRAYRGGCGELAEVLGRWDAFAASVRARLAAGHDQYGSAWQSRGVEGNLREAGDEAADLAAYAFFAWVLMQAAGPANQARNQEAPG